MILADKIINERKKNGWSQEELAEQLSVSRQSVSKWEGAQAVPDLQKIILMANIFGVSTDYLLKDEMEPENISQMAVTSSDSVNKENAIKVSLEDANEFISLSKEIAPKIAAGVSICILSPALLIFLAGLSEEAKFGVSDVVAATIGTLILLLMVAAAVFMFIVFGSKIKKYDFLEKENIETEYGVDGMVRERKKMMEGHRTLTTAVGVIMCILSSIPLIITACLNMPDYVVCSMVSLLLIIISIAVNLFVRIGIEWNSYEKLLQEGDFTTYNKKIGKKIDNVSGLYWAVVLAGYLAWSFITMRWEVTWIVWPIAAVLFGAVSALIRAVTKEA